MTTAVSAAPVQRAQPQAPSASRLTRWLPMLGMLVLLVVVTGKALRPLSDPDTWWHLRLGQLFRGEWSVSDPGQLSSFAREDWVPTQWLPEVVASWFHEMFGLAGVSWLVGTAMLVLLVCIYRNAREESDSLAATLATGVSLLGMLASLTPRPHLMTYVLLTVATGAWLRTARDLRPRWWLVPLTWVWACSHGMWFAGVAVGALVTLGLVLDRRVVRRQALHLAAVPLLSVVAAALTPAGPTLLRAPFAVGEITSSISEWAPPSFREFGPPMITAAMAAVIVVMWARRGGTPWTHVGILALAAGWTLLSARTVTLGALMMAPLLASVMQSWLPRRTRARATRGEKATLATFLGVCMVGLALVAPATASSPDKVPTALADELDRLPGGTTVFNSYAIGGWLHWRHPHLSPVADGLTESYGAAYLKEFIDATRAEPGWRQFVDSTRASHALLEKNSALPGALQGQLGWEAVGANEGYVLLRAPTQ